MGAQNKVLTHYVNLPQFCSLRLLCRRFTAEAFVPEEAAALRGMDLCDLLGTFSPALALT